MSDKEADNHKEPSADKLEFNHLIYKYFRQQDKKTKLYISLSSIAVLIFILFVLLAPFRDRLFQQFYPKSFSFAAGLTSRIAFLDGQNQVITQTNTPAIKLQLNAPWGASLAKTTSHDMMGMVMDGQTKQVLAAKILTIPVSQSSDDVNEVNGALDNAYGPTSSTLWIGNGGVGNGTSYTGLRFQNIAIPKNAVITSAHLAVVSNSNQWINVELNMSAENIGNSPIFSRSQLPSKRSLTNSNAAYSENVNWRANNQYSLGEIKAVIQEVVNRTDWKPGNSLSIILKGTGSSPYSRKFIKSFDGSSANTTNLVISYEDGGVTPTPIPSGAPSLTPTMVPPTATPTSIPTPTPVVHIASAIIAEDNTFTKNVKNISPFTTNPLTVDYTLSSPGTVIVYVKFISDTGLSEIDQSSIIYTTPINTPTSAPIASPTPTPLPVGSTGSNSHAMGLWNPNTAYDTCPSYPANIVTDQDKINYIKSIHDSYKVLGPDGKWYPTWHPAVDSATGCKFGHEHGQDPSKASIWAQVKDRYAFIKPDGTKDLAEAGIPFGFVNEQMDIWTAANSNVVAMRHEDHVGHKVAIANNFQIGLDRGNGGAQFFYPGVTCNYIVKVHQGTHSKDAFENNLHEILYNVGCSDGHTVNLDTMGEFGSPGQFTRSCDSAGDRTSIIQTGFSYSNANYPSNADGARGISDRSCIETGFLVPQGKFSQNPYEFWPVMLSLKKASGLSVVDNLNLLFDVEDSIRYYNPGHIDPVSGLVDNLGRMQDLCYENFNGRTFRGLICDTSTNYGAITGITWDNPKAGFRGLNRGTYFKPGVTHNAGGATVWYSDPFGNNAQITPFVGSIKQFVSADTINYAANQNAFETANVINMEHDDGHGTVHAPN